MGGLCLEMVGSLARKILSFLESVALVSELMISVDGGHVYILDFHLS